MELWWLSQEILPHTGSHEHQVFTIKEDRTQQYKAAYVEQQFNIIDNKHYWHPEKEKNIKVKASLKKNACHLKEARWLFNKVLKDGALPSTFIGNDQCLYQ